MVQEEGTAIFAQMLRRPALVRAVRTLVVMFWPLPRKVHGSQTTTMCRPVVYGGNSSDLCARSPVCQLHARSRGLGCLARFHDHEARLSVSEALDESARDGKCLRFSVPLDVYPANNKGVHFRPRSGHVSECAVV